MLSPRAYVNQQVDQVHRRLRRKAIARSLPLGWTVAFLVAAIALLASPFVPALAELPLWAFAAGAVVLGVALGIVIGFRRAPGARDAALAIDRECGLKERVVTAVTLPPEVAQTPVGQALLDDAQQRLSQADLHRSFGKGPRKTDFVAPLLAAALAAGAFYAGPTLKAWLAPRGNDDGTSAISAVDVQRELENIKKISAFQKNEELARSKEFEKMAAEWDKLIGKPIDPSNEDQVRERAREVQDFKDKLKEQVDKMEGRGKDVKEALAKAFDGKDKDGPAKDLLDALAKGDFAKAAAEFERLHKKHQDKGFDKKEEEKLAEQLKDAEDRLKRLTEKKEAEERLKKDHEAGKLNKDELARELDRLNGEIENLKDLADLADLLDGLKQELGKADAKGDKAAKLLEALKRLDKAGDLKDLKGELKRLEEAGAALCRLCEGDKMGDGLGGGKKAGGRRSVGKEPDGKVASAAERGEVDPTSKVRITGTAMGGGAFSPIPAKEVGGVIEQAAQEAPDIIERTRIPPEFAELARGYFQKLGGQK